jgi:tRNA(Ile)-lysidine synthase
MSRQDLALEHRILKPFQRRKAFPRRWLLAVSGGVDSMVLAEFTRRWSRYLGVDFAVAHVHHGLAVSASQRKFRSQARSLVERWCVKNGACFLTNPPENAKLRSEDELRRYRESWLQKWLSDLDFEAVVYAHHSDDLLETRLLRLIRGTGPQGLKAMRLWDGKKLRPLLSVSRAEIEAYAKITGLEWCEDPSNSSREPLRNWVRHEWLAQLEKRQKGAVRSLGRSFSLLARARGKKSGKSHAVANAGVRRKDINSASFSEREMLIAAYLRRLGFKNYAQTHVHEILKRIDTRRKHLKFEMLGVVFEVTPDFLRASRV